MPLSMKQIKLRRLRCSRGGLRTSSADLCAVTNGCLFGLIPSASRKQSADKSKCFPGPIVPICGHVQYHYHAQGNQNAHV